MDARAIEYRRMKNCFAMNKRMRKQLEQVYKYAQELQCDLEQAWAKWVDTDNARKWSEKHA